MPGGSWSLRSIPISAEVVLMYNNDEEINAGAYGFAVVPAQSRANYL